MWCLGLKKEVQKYYTVKNWTKNNKIQTRMCTKLLGKICFIMLETSKNEENIFPISFSQTFPDKLSNFSLTFSEFGQNAHFSWLKKVFSNVQVFPTQWEPWFLNVLKDHSISFPWFVIIHNLPGFPGVLEPCWQLVLFQSAGLPGCVGTLLPKVLLQVQTERQQ